MNVKLFASVAVIALTMCALGGIVLTSDNSDAAGSGTSEDPYDSLNVPLGSLQGQTIYIYEGSSVNLAPLQGIGASSFTDGFGLTQASQNSGVSGTLTKTGTLTIQLTNGQSITLIVVSSEADIDFTSPKAVSGISGGSISYTAQTNIDATFSESGGTGASWLSVNSSTGKVTGTFPTVSSMTSYTYIIKATSSTNSSNTTTQTITINVYPVAKITATTTSVSGTEGEAISSVSLTGNIGMTFAKSSGSFPAGVTMTSAGVISGTPTESGSFTVVVKGTTTVGPSQSPTITIKFNIESAEDTLSISVADPAASYKVGESISLALTSNVEGTAWSVSGTAASFMSVSGNSVVGSVPSSYDDVTELSLTVTAETPKGQTASKTVNFSVEPVISFTTVPTADCVITPVYEYDENGNPIIDDGSHSGGGIEIPELRMFTEVWADGADFSFTDTLTICGTFTGTNAETVTWYWGDGSSDVGNKVNHTYEEPGTYEIRLVASNDLGDSEVTITVTVGDTGNDLLYYGIIVVLAIIVVYLAYRVLTAGKRRSH